MQGKYADLPAWSEEKGAGRTVGLGAAGDRAVDREVQRDSLLCPDYLRYCTALEFTDVLFLTDPV